MTMGRKVVALNVLRADDVLGVNTRQHLAQAEAIMQARIQDHWMTEGVTIVDPRNTYIDGRASIGRDTVIYPFTVITGTVKVGSRLPGRAASHISATGPCSTTASKSAPSSRSSSRIGTGTIVRHLAYLGDAAVGEQANIGATAVTANFDGVEQTPPRSAPAAASVPARSWSRRSTSAMTPSSGPTPSSPATRMSPTARPSSACPPGRSSPSDHDAASSEFCTLMRYLSLLAILVLSTGASSPGRRSKHPCAVRRNGRDQGGLAIPG